MSDICYSAWKRLNDVCIEHGLDVKAQPDEAAEWLSAKLDCARTRDARVEPPPLHTWILYWDGGIWVFDCYDARDRRWVDCGESIDDKPYWRPMPPKPTEEK